MYSALRFLPSILRPARPIHFTFFVTRACNARCRFCFYLVGGARPDVTEPLSLEEVRRVSESLGSLLWLALSGGEVFLHHGLAEIVRTFYERNRPSIILLPTNGIDTERIVEAVGRILRECPRSVIAVKLSLDGDPETHDGMRGVPGAHERVMATREALIPLLERHPNFELGINTVFCRENQHGVPGLIERVEGMPGVRTHTVSMLRGGARIGVAGGVDANLYAACIGRLAQGLRRGDAATYGFAGARLKAAQDIVQRELILGMIEGRGRALPCLAGRLNLVMTECGELYPCEEFTPGMRLGNVRDRGYDVQGMAMSGKALLDDIKRNCWCTHECYVMTNILFNPRMYPRLLYEYMRMRG